MQMRLNEDYFDNLKLTDDDIITHDDDIITYDDGIVGDEYDNPEEMYEYMQSKYSHCLIFDVKIKDKYLADRTSHIVKRLQYIFNVYGIEYS